MKLNFVLIDFESLQPKNLDLLRGGPNRIKIFVGANQAKLSSDIAMTIQTFGADAEYIRIDGNGKNALDFHIAFHLGRLAKEHPDSSFYVISHDGGFDPLIRHINAQKITCRRLESVEEMAPAKVNKPLSIGEKCDLIIAKLTKSKTNRPRKEKTLLSFINAQFAGNLAEDDVKKIVELLVKRQVTIIEANKVQYQLPI